MDGTTRRTATAMSMSMANHVLLFAIAAASIMSHRTQAFGLWELRPASLASSSLSRRHHHHCHHQGITRLRMSSMPPPQNQNQGFNSDNTHIQAPFDVDAYLRQSVLNGNVDSNGESEYGGGAYYGINGNGNADYSYANGFSRPPPTPPQTPPPPHAHQQQQHQQQNEIILYPEQIDYLTTLERDDPQQADSLKRCLQAGNSFDDCAISVRNSANNVASTEPPGVHGEEYRNGSTQMPQVDPDAAVEGPEAIDVDYAYDDRYQAGEDDVKLEELQASYQVLLDHYRQQQLDYETDVQLYQLQINHTNQEYEFLRNERDELQTMWTKEQTAREQLDKELQAANTEFSELQDQYTSEQQMWQIENTRLQDELLTVQQAYERDESQWKYKTNLLESKIATLNATLKSAIESNEFQLETSRTAIQMAESTIESLQRDLRETSKKLQDTRAQRNTIMTENQKQNEIQLELERTYDEMDALQLQYTNQMKEKDVVTNTLQQELNDAYIQMEQYQIQLEQTQIQLEETDELYQQQRQKEKEYRNEMEQLRKEERLRKKAQEQEERRRERMELQQQRERERMELQEQKRNEQEQKRNERLRKKEEIKLQQARDRAELQERKEVLAERKRREDAEAQAKKQREADAQQKKQQEQQKKRKSNNIFASISTKLPQIPTLESWEIQESGEVTGTVMNHPEIEDGTEIITSPLSNSKLAAFNAVVTTGSGSKYRLGTAAPPAPAEASPEETQEDNRKSINPILSPFKQTWTFGDLASSIGNGFGSNAVSGPSDLTEKSKKLGLTGQSLGNGKYLLAGKSRKSANGRSFIFTGYKSDENFQPIGSPYAIKVTSNKAALRREHENYQKIKAGTSRGVVVHVEEYLRKADSGSKRWDDMSALVMEKGREDLKMYRYRAGSLDDDTLREALFSACKCLQHVHSARLVWTDLKTENFVIVEDERSDDDDKKADDDSEESVGVSFKGIDFESAMPLKSNPMDYTPEACPPEFAKAFAAEEAHDFVLEFNYDVWSFGMLAYELAIGEGYFDGRIPEQIMKLLVDIKQDEMEKTIDRKMEGINPELIDLIKSCLQMDPRKRPTLQGIFKHPFFRGKSDNKLGGIFRLPF